VDRCDDLDAAPFRNDRLATDMSVKETTAVVVMALGLSLLATVYPSRRAARLDPVEALRYE
jgi:lipoprotein-releasing system permease protein